MDEADVTKLILFGAVVVSVLAVIAGNAIDKWLARRDEKKLTEGGEA